MKKLLVLLVACLMVATVSAKELTDTKYHEYLDSMEFLGSEELDGQICETVLVENKVDGVVYQVFFDFDNQTATLKVSDLKLHNKLMARRGMTSEQFTKKVIQFYLNTEVMNDGTILYKVGQTNRNE